MRNCKQAEIAIRHSLPQDVCFHAAVTLLTDYGTVNRPQQVFPITTTTQQPRPLAI